MFFTPAGSHLFTAARIFARLAASWGRDFSTCAMRKMWHSAGIILI
jgi:hypothetical protein